MSVATASAVLRLRLTRTISPALPRLTAAIAHAQPTLPVPIIPIFMAASIAGNQPAGDRAFRTGGLQAAGSIRRNVAAASSSVCSRHRSPLMPGERTDHSLATRVASNRNQVRRSASSIQFSIKLALATSSCLSQIAWASRKLAASCLLSSRSSASMSRGVTKSASLSNTRCKRPMWPIERSVVPPILSHPLGDGVGGRENLLALLVEEEMIVAEVRAGYVPMEILGLQVKRKHVGEHEIERAGNLRHGVGAQVGRRIERSDPQRGSILCCRHFVSPSDAMVGRWARRVTVRTQNHATAEKRSDRWRTSPSLGDSYMRSGATYRLIVLAPS